MPTLGEVIRELREQARLSQRKLADAAGMSPTSINLVENGKQHRFNGGNLEDLARALGTTATEIRRRVAGDAPPPGLTAIYFTPDVAARFFQFARLAGQETSDALHSLLEMGWESMQKELEREAAAKALAHLPKGGGAIVNADDSLTHLAAGASKKATAPAEAPSEPAATRKGR